MDTNKICNLEDALILNLDNSMFEQDEIKIHISPEGRFFCMDTVKPYVVMERETYESIIGKLPENNPICKKCDKVRDGKSPDPCLGYLPGVSYACCGHGEQGYIKFENGITIRGKFSIERS